MTSQSPPDPGLPSKDYVDAWASLRIMVLEQGLSWSGREKNHLFLNLGDRTFAEFSALSTADSIEDSRALSVLDWDDDGRLDLLLKNRTAPRLQFFHNRLASEAHWVSVRLTGVRCNRDAIGALVEIEAGGRTFKRRLYAGDGYLAQSSKRLNFGLGPARRIERLRVRWPDGALDEYRALEVDRRYQVTQGAAAPELVPARPHPALAAALPAVPQEIGRSLVRVPLLEKLPLAPLRIPAYGNPARTVADLSGGPVLLNLWGTTCAACLKEFGELARRRAELARAGLSVVPLATDPPAARERCLELLAGFGLEREAGYADEDLLAALEPLLREVLERFDVVPLPTSLLLDQQGQLVALYLGPVEPDQLLSDLALLARMDPGKLAGTRLPGGVRLLPRGRDFASLAEAFEQLERPELSAFYRELAGR